MRKRIWELPRLSFGPLTPDSGPTSFCVARPAKGACSALQSLIVVLRHHESAEGKPVVQPRNYCTPRPKALCRRHSLARALLATGESYLLKHCSDALAETRCQTVSILLRSVAPKPCFTKQDPSAFVPFDSIGASLV